MKPRALTLSSFVGLVVCFFLSFVTISCEGREVATLTGVQLVTGGSVSGPSFFGQAEEREYPPSGAARIALLGAVVGALLLLLRKGRGYWFVGTGAVACGSLLTMKSGMDAEVLKQGLGVLEVSYGFGFWAAALLGCGAVVGGILMEKESSLTATTGMPEPEENTTAAEQAPTLSAREAAVTGGTAAAAASGIPAEAFARGLERWVSETVVPSALSAWHTVRPRITKAAQSRRVIAGTVGMFVLFTGSYAVLKADPQEDVRGLVVAQSECEGSHRNNVASRLAPITVQLQQKAFESRSGGMEALESALTPARDQYSQCVAAVAQQRSELEAKYVGSRMETAFYQALNYANGLGRAASDVEAEVPEVATTRSAIASIVPPIPAADAVKNHLIGRTVDGWRFAYASEIEGLNILRSNVSNSDLMMRLDLTLRDYISGLGYVALLDAHYTLTPDGDWTLNRLHEIIVGRDTLAYRRGDGTFLAGRWRWPTNFAVYNDDGTWAGVWDNGRRREGVWHLIGNDLVLTEGSRVWTRLRIRSWSDSELVTNDGRAERVQGQPQ